MERKIILLAVGLLLSQLTGCWQTAVYDEKLTGPYHLSAIDDYGQMSVCYVLEKEDSCIGRVDETVFSVGWNEQFIVAKQHPSGDRSVTYYFILEMKKDGVYADPGKSVTGPLSAVEYEKQAKIKSLPTFTKTFEDLK